MVVLSAAVPPAYAADWPNRPIHFIVPFPALNSRIDERRGCQ